jgi:hypothetical protein
VTAVARKVHRALAHYHITVEIGTDSQLPVMLDVATAETGRRTYHYRSKSAAMSDMRRMYPGLRFVDPGATFFAPVALAKPAAPLELAPVAITPVTVRAGLKFRRFDRAGVYELGCDPYTSDHWYAADDEGHTTWFSLDEIEEAFTAGEWTVVDAASDPLAPVRLSGDVWGTIDARNDRRGDAYLAYDSAWPAAVTMVPPIPGHYEAFAAAYLAAYYAERDRLHGTPTHAEGRAAVDAVLARTGGGGK